MAVSPSTRRSLLTVLAAAIALVGCGVSPTATRKPRSLQAPPPVAGQPQPGLAPGAPDPDLPPQGDGDERASMPVPRVTLVHDQLIVGVRKGFKPFLDAPANRRLMAAGQPSGRIFAQPTKSIEMGLSYQVVHIPVGMTRDEATKRLQSMAGVQIVAPNRVYSASITPKDERYEEQWAFKKDRLNAEVVWDRAIDCRNVAVAVLDTGVDYNHPDLAGRVILGPDLADGDSDPMDIHGHGTHVAGIIGAAGNNGLGVAGVAWNVKIMAIRVLGKNGSGNTDTVVEGIKYAVDHGARVINLSLGTTDTTVDPVVHQAMAYAKEKGVLVVAAAGNNHGAVGSPANDPVAIAVSSTSSLWVFEWLSFFSNRGDKIEVSAPGGAILSTLPVNGGTMGKLYGKLSGTSMAAPFVAGEAALIFAQHPQWKADQVRARIKTAVDDKGTAGRDDKYGYGRINLAKAID